ncbi:MAG TPA: vanadium-dependent haloperoxidase [Caulobacter sp.]|nr:vanadium-dependent haloperoxidase [Caulobacter sp.]
MRKTLTLLLAAAALAVAQPAAADTVSDWWEFATKISNASQPPPGSGRTPDGERALTRASLAMFEAANAIDRRYESYLGVPAGDPAASQEAAIITAAYKVLVHHFPTQKAALDDSYGLAMAALPDGPAKEAGRLIGEQAAAASLTAGGLDPAKTPVPYRPVTRPGQWTATGLPSIDPYFSTFKPWGAGNDEAALRPPPPVALTSERWARDYEEIRRLGGKTGSERTPHQTLMARYRQAPDLAPAVRLAADAPGRTPVQNARMIALYQMAGDDAAYAMGATKAHYDFWRPITAIRNGDQDGNDATPRDAAWTPLLGTPNFAEYPCGHCTYAAAIAEVMKEETGAAPSYGVRVGSQAIPNSVMQVLPSWDRWVQEVSDSRIYGGVHFRFSNEAGETVGRRAARNLLATAMRPLPAKAAAKPRRR